MEHTKLEDFQDLTAMTDVMICRLSAMGLHEYITELTHSYSLLSRNYYLMVEGGIDGELLSFDDGDIIMYTNWRQYASSCFAHTSMLRDMDIITMLTAKEKKRNV